MDYWVISMARFGISPRLAFKRLFVTPFQADTWRNKVQTMVGYVYTTRPATWREREGLMFEAQTDAHYNTIPAVYQPPVWDDERWWVNCRGFFKDMFVHISLADPDTIAFTEDERKGEADRQTLMKPGKFLQKFLGAGKDGLIEHGPMKGHDAQVSKMQIAYYAEWHKVGKRPFSDDVLAFAETEAEMIRVYENGPDSCMMGKGWDARYHPVRVYAGGGLKMAYLTSTAGAVVARAICWPDKECFNRVYPTPNTDAQRDMYDELMGRLKALGWQSINENSECFEGALLRLLDGRYGNTLMPYLDHEYGVERHLHEGKWWWRMTHDMHHQDNTDGTYNHGEDEDEDESRWECENCNDTYSDGYDAYTVYSRWDHRPRADRTGYGVCRGDQQWCSGCRDNDTFYCEGTDEHYDSNCAEMLEVGGNTYEANWARANGAWQCSYSEEWYFKGDDPPVVLATGEMVHEDERDDYAFQCQATGLWWPWGRHSDAVPGYHLGFDGMDPHPIELEHGMPTMPEDPEDVTAWAVAHVLPEVRPPVTIDLAKSGLTFDAAYIATPRAWAAISTNV